MKTRSIIRSNNIIIKLFLAILSIAYFIAVVVRNYLYDKKILKSFNLPSFCIGIGNIVAGGAGKTPFVIWLAEKLRSDGITIGVITNGYGGRKSAHYLVSDGNKIFTKPPEAQDEAYLIATHKIPVASGKNRIAAARVLKKVDCIILDDSFQYRKIKKDIEILILGKRPFDNGHLLPAGLLREPVSGIKRADLILSRSPIDSFRYESPVFRYSLKALNIVDYRGKQVEPKNLKRPVVAVCAIANPEDFFDDLRAIGINPDKKISFPDHHIYSRKEIDSLQKISSIVTTEKDKTKLGNMKNLYILQRKIEIKPDIYKIIKDKLIKAINGR